MHKAQCGTGAKFAELHKDSKITAYILNVAKSEEKGTCKIDLGLEAANPLATLKKGDKCVGVVRTVQWDSSFPLMLELSGYLRASVYFHDMIKDPAELEAFMKKTKEGTVVTCYSRFDASAIGKVKEKGKERLRVSLRDDWAAAEKQEEFKVGDLVVCRCMNTKAGHGAAVQLTEKKTGLVDITETSDEFSAAPLEAIAKRGVFAARVVETVMGPDGKSVAKYQLSARKSLLDGKLWKILQTASTYEFQQHFEYISEEGDMRAKILK